MLALYKFKDVDEDCAEICEEDGCIHSNVQYTDRTVPQILSKSILSSLLAQPNSTVCADANPSIKRSTLQF